MNFKEGFDRLSLALAAIAVPFTFWLILEDTNWIAPTKGEGFMWLGLSALAGVGVWLLTRGVFWIVAGFTQRHREPPV